MRDESARTRAFDEVRLHELRQLVGTGKYEIDTQAVADALLRRRPLGDTRAGDRDRDPGTHAADLSRRVRNRSEIGVSVGEGQPSRSVENPSDPGQRSDRGPQLRVGGELPGRGRGQARRSSS